MSGTRSGRSQQADMPWQFIRYGLKQCKTFVLQDLVKEVRISICSVHLILGKDLAMLRVSTKCVSKLLASEILAENARLHKWQPELPEHLSCVFTSTT